MAERPLSIGVLRVRVPASDRTTGEAIAQALVGELSRGLAVPEGRRVASPEGRAVAAPEGNVAAVSLRIAQPTGDARATAQAVVTGINTALGGRRA